MGGKSKVSSRRDQKSGATLSCTAEKAQKERWWEKPFVARQPLCYQ